MEKILLTDTYDIPFNRIVKLGLMNQDKSKPVYVTIIDPPGFEDVVLTASNRGDSPVVAVHRRPGNGRKNLHPITRVTLTSYQLVETVLSKEEPVKEPIAPKERENLNPPPITTGDKKSAIKNLITTKPTDWKKRAIEQTEKRKEKIARIRSEVNESKPLKPIGYDSKYILTCDDCDYTRGMGIIEILRRLEEKHNIQSGLSSHTQRRLLCEFYDVISFSGIEVVIGLYIALGTKSKGKGDLGYLSNWYKNELSKIYSPTSIGNIKKKGAQLMPKPLKKINPGLSIRQAEKIIGDLFTDAHTGEPLRVPDLQCDIYQPIFFKDEQSRVYSRDETPSARLVDIAINTGLDPLYFQTRRVEDIGVPLGPTRRSFDLPFAQHNRDTTMVSVGAGLTYHEPNPKMDGINPAQMAFLNKRKSHRVEYLDTQKYMQDHSSSVSYLRIESDRMDSIMANSISHADLDACKESANRSKWWSNGKKTAIEWS